MHRLHFREIVRDTLDAMGPPYDSSAAEELLMLIAAHESQLGRFAWQARGRDLRPGGPACGPYQMEPVRYNDTWQRAPNALIDKLWYEAFPYRDEGPYRDDLRAEFKRMAWDWRWATMMARSALWIVPHALPRPSDVAGLDAYWFNWWCQGCAGKPGDAARDYQRLALEG